MTPTPPALLPLDLTITATTGRELGPFVRGQLPAARALLAAATPGAATVPATRAARSAAAAVTELSLAFVGDARMAALHRQFLNVAGPTDVLTFPLDTDARGRVTSGEVIVCVPWARRQARARGAPERVEVLLYALHGLLHLCGFDDLTPAAYRTMHRTEDDILIALGFGPVFGPAAHATNAATVAAAASADPTAAAARAARHRPRGLRGDAR